MFKPTCDYIVRSWHTVIMRIEVMGWHHRQVSVLNVCFQSYPVSSWGWHLQLDTNQTEEAPYLIHTGLTTQLKTTRANITAESRGFLIQHCSRFAVNIGAFVQNHRSLSVFFSTRAHTDSCGTLQLLMLISVSSLSVATQCVSHHYTPDSLQWGKQSAQSRRQALCPSANPSASITPLVFLR